MFPPQLSFFKITKEDAAQKVAEKKTLIQNDIQEKLPQALSEKLKAAQMVVDEKKQAEDHKQKVGVL